MNIKHLNDGQLIVSTTPCSNYEQTCTLVIVVKESLNNSSIVINQVSDHSGSDEQLVKLPSDGKFIIYTIVIPTEDGICHVNYDKNKDFYYYSNGRVYLVKPTGKKSINLEDLILVNSIYTNIKLEKTILFSKDKLLSKYLEKLNSIFHNKKESIRYLELLLNVINYFEECGDYDLAMRILEENDISTETKKCCCCHG